MSDPRRLMANLRQPGTRRILDAIKVVKQEAPALFDTPAPSNKSAATATRIPDDRAGDRRVVH
jgi:hypothetical protein